MKNRIKVLRAEADWTQAQLAKRAQVSRQTINAIETGKFDPSLPLAFTLAHIFDTTIEAIFEPDRGPIPPPGIAVRRPGSDAEPAYTRKDTPA